MLQNCSNTIPLSTFDLISLRKYLPTFKYVTITVTPVAAEHYNAKGMNPKSHLLGDVVHQRLTLRSWAIYEQD